MAFDRVSLQLGGRRVLEDVSLAIGTGEFIGLLGPNGAGKTTLMRAALGLVRPARGAIRVLGAPVGRGNPAIGYLPQSRSGLGDLRLNGREVVTSAVDGHRWGLPVGRARARAADRALDLAGAQALADRPLGAMSGGERQRLLIAQALVGEPRILLLDEPLISLDLAHQKATIELVRRLRDELKLTVLFSAHEVNPLIGAIDRVLYLGGGHAALGPIEEVVTAPVLSRLYGMDIEVLRAGGRIFVMAGGYDMEHDEHRHDHGHAHGHDHSHHGHRHDAAL
ncbi:MAG TPA: ATP-binding cassette domain-containing protein [Hyphomicrobiales bacterium]|nr:ATP-binding cassette domain-containing protein [Hyphomicrobiales bacterium]